MVKASAKILMNVMMKMSVFSIKSVPILTEATTVPVMKATHGMFLPVNKRLLIVSTLTNV